MGAIRLGKPKPSLGPHRPSLGVPPKPKPDVTTHRTKDSAGVVVPKRGSGTRAQSKASRGRPDPTEPRWVAWSSDLSRIVAYGATPAKARAAAIARGEPEPALEPEQPRIRLA